MGSSTRSPRPAAPARELQHEQPAQQRQRACVAPFCVGRFGPNNNSNNTAGRRESARPPRPLTIYASAPQGGARLRRDRPKSTAILVPSASVAKAFAENPLDADGSHTDGLPTLDEKQVMKDMGKKRGSKAVSTPRTALDKPWLSMKDPWARYAYWITYATVVVFGLGMGALRIFLSQRDVILQDPASLCPVMSEDFTGATTECVFGDNGWLAREVDMSWFGNGQFEMTTASNANSFVAAPPAGSFLASSVEGKPRLYLLPTLTSDVIPLPQTLDGAVYNPAGAAPDLPPNTPAYLAACSGVSNATLGKILPPVMSAWIRSRRDSREAADGRLDVTRAVDAGLSHGTWGDEAPAPRVPSKADRRAWRDTRRDGGSTLDGGGGPPRDGVERGLRVRLVHGRVDGRGAVLVVVVVVLLAAGVGSFTDCRDERKAAYLGWMTGLNYMRSPFNWGPTTFLNAVSKTYGAWPWRRGRFNGGFHMYVLQWDERFMRMYVDSRLHHMMELKFNKPFWDRGDFPNVVQNRTESVIPENPWVNGTKAAPFDQLVWFSLLGLSFLDNYYDYHVHIHPPIHPSTPDHYPLPL
ncbi:hypothetical protein C8J57DRAFT_1243003 [Mycena rebaudengoi]|nr:hypothetical protein C8J57DRAFT_1243003 [Mycena rebaudengoi]